MAEFLTIGEALVVLASEDIDTSLDDAQHFSKFLAGAELNVAIGICRLEHTAAYLSQVGNDPFGRFITQSAAEAGIETENLLINPEKLTGFYLKQKLSKGDPAVSYFRKNSAAASMTKADLISVKFDDVKIAHLSGIFPALSELSLKTFRELNHQLKEHNVTTVFDPNLRPALWKSQEIMAETLNELARHSHIVLPGISEGKILTGSGNPEAIADFYLKQQGGLTETVIVKLGAAGAYVKTITGESLTIPGFKADNVIDTVGAGDGFAVGLESALLEGKTLEVAIRRGCAVGALAVQSPGDNDGYPTREALHHFYQKNRYQADI
ncbi:sugar kinase [Lactovum odontotermitis]